MKTDSQSHSSADLFDDESTYSFRPIHYLGSKLRVLDQIGEAIDSLEPTGGLVCDLFSGSGTVSRYLSRRRQVLAVDVQEYSRVLAEAVLNGAAPSTSLSAETELIDDVSCFELLAALEPLVSYESQATLSAFRGDLEPLRQIMEIGSLATWPNQEANSTPALVKAVNESLARMKALPLSGPETVCVRHFGGQYFSHAQAAELDCLLNIAHDSSDNTLIAATLSTASHLVNSVGKQFAQPIRVTNRAGDFKRHNIKKIAHDRSLSARTLFLRYLKQYCSLPTVRRDHVAIRSDYRHALAAPALLPTVVYADPPYTRDHYSRFYHCLETMALGDEPTISKSNLHEGKGHSRGSYRSDRHQSPFCIKSEAPSAFQALFQGVAALNIPLVLSYSGYDPNVDARPRVMSLKSVQELARESFAEVEVTVLSDIDHNKLNAAKLNKLSGGTNEVLLLCSQPLKL